MESINRTLRQVTNRIILSFILFYSEIQYLEQLNSLGLNGSAELFILLASLR